MIKPSTLFDVRFVEHNIRRGLITRKQYQQHLDSLQDNAEEGTQCETVFATPYADRHPPEEPSDSETA